MSVCASLSACSAVSVLAGLLPVPSHFRTDAVNALFSSVYCGCGMIGGA